MAKAFNLALRTLALDSLYENPATDAEAVRTWIKDEIDETKMINALPIGPDEAMVAVRSRLLRCRDVSWIDLRQPSIWGR